MFHCLMGRVASLTFVLAALFVSAYSSTAWADECRAICAEEHQKHVQYCQRNPNSASCSLIASNLRYCHSSCESPKGRCQILVLHRYAGGGDSCMARCGTDTSCLQNCLTEQERNKQATLQRECAHLPYSSGGASSPQTQASAAEDTPYSKCTRPILEQLHACRKSCGANQNCADNCAQRARAARDQQCMALPGAPARQASAPPQHPPATNQESSSSAPAIGRGDKNHLRVDHCIEFQRRDTRAGVLNKCDFTVQLAYCFTTPGTVWTCRSHGGRSGGGGDGIGPGLWKSLPDDPRGYDVKFVACRGKLGEVLALLEANGKTGCF